ncbi:Zn-ribbon domain-containing OB-fold protein [Geodermatophilus sp. URMC 64]
MTARPAPRRGVYERPFWEYVQARQLRLQRCSSCGQFWYPPGPACPRCLSSDWAWEAISGRGSVLSWVIFHRGYFESMPPPYTVVAAELEEGPILLTDVAAPPEQLFMGMPVRLTYRPTETADGGEFLLYHWEPDVAGAGQQSASNAS